MPPFRPLPTLIPSPLRVGCSLVFVVFSCALPAVTCVREAIRCCCSAVPQLCTVGVFSPYPLFQGQVWGGGGGGGGFEPPPPPPRASFEWGGRGVGGLCTENGRTRFSWL